MTHLARITVVAVVLCLAAFTGLAAQEAADTEGTSGETEASSSVWKKMFGGSPRSAPEATQSSGPDVTGSYRYSKTVNETQALLRRTRAPENPEVRSHMDQVDRGEAGPVELEAFGNLLASTGFLELGVVYFQEAIRFDDDNPHFWTNLGTAQRQIGDNSAAIDAYKKAVQIDPSMAIAQYNLGVVYSAKGKYDKALEQYVKAFTIDPNLADPKVNPQVVNNYSMPAASLLLYQRRAGDQALPLIPVDEMNPTVLEPDIAISD